MSADTELSALLHETRRFPPPADFSAAANAQPDIYDHAAKDRVGFWAEQAGYLSWDRPWESELNWNPPFAQWFVGGQLNASVNCVDRHVAAGIGDRVAYRWIGEPEGDTRDITYRELQEHGLPGGQRPDRARLGQRGSGRDLHADDSRDDRSRCSLARGWGLHTPWCLAAFRPRRCARIIDCDARMVITADGGYRRVPRRLKPAVDEAIVGLPAIVEHVLVVRRTGQDVGWMEGRDVWWHELVDAAEQRARRRAA